MAVAKGATRVAATDDEVQRGVAGNFLAVVELRGLGDVYLIAARRAEDPVWVHVGVAWDGFAALVSATCSAEPFFTHDLAQLALRVHGHWAWSAKAGDVPAHGRCQVLVH